MTFVDKHDKIMREIVQKRKRRLAGYAPVKVPRVVFYARAIAYFLHHFYVVTNALAYALRLYQLVIVGKKFDLLFAVALYLLDCVHHCLMFHGVMARGENRGVRKPRNDIARHNVELAHPVYFVAEKLDAYAVLGHVGGKNIHGVAAHAEIGSFGREIVALVVDVYKPSDKRVARHLVVGAHGQRKPVIFFGRAQTVNARHRGDDYRVAPLVQRTSRAMAELIYFVVDCQILFDVSIGCGQVRFGLIVVVITYKKLHAVFGEELAELVAKLCRKRFIVRKNKRRTLYAFDNVSHGKSLAATRNAL